MTARAEAPGVSARPSRARLYLRLGRVSNLPTVWTNALAGIVLSGGATDAVMAVVLAASLSLFYVGGMFLNDAFDRAIDAVERPERPIPAGHIAASEVFGAGFGLLGAGLACVTALALSRHVAPLPVALSGVVLGALVVLYDAWHKQNPLSPIVMGLCRGAVYVTAGLGAGGAVTRPLLLGALSLSAYVVGLTFVARQENRKAYRAGGTLALIASPALFAVLAPGFSAPTGVLLALFTAWAAASILPLFSSGTPNVPRSVVRLIAGISLVDGLSAAAYGAPALAACAVLGVGATLVLQRWVRGT